MNYIKQLQEENNRLKEIITNCQNEINTFNLFLHGPKFTGVQSDGSRKDWISTSDTIFAIKEFQRVLSGVEHC